MRKRVLIVPFCFLAWAGILALSGCRKDASGPAAPAEIRGELKVVSATPSGETGAPSESGSIVVIFDHPMTALEALHEGKGTSFLKLNPSVPGRHRWLGPRALAFTPDDRFPPATEFEVTVPAGTLSVDGYRLDRAHSWHFRTVLPRLRAHAPSDGQTSLGLDAEILLVFNQGVSTGNVKDFLSLSSVDSGDRAVAVGFDVVRPSEKILEKAEIKALPEESLLIRPKKRLKPDLAYLVEVKAGIRGTGGPLGSAEGAAFRFETFKTFRFESLDAGAGHNPYEPLKFQFSNPVSYRKFVQSVKFVPEVVIPEYYAEWDQSTPVIWLNLALDPETDYEVRIPANLEDDFGNTLGRAASPRFKTAAFPPSVSMTTGFGVIEAYADPLYPVYALNIPGFLVQAAEVGRDGVIPLLNQEKIFWTNQNIQPGPGFFAHSRKRTFRLPRNKRQAVPVDLKPVLRKKTGFVFLQLDTGLPEEYEKFPKAFLQVTELGVSAKFSPDNNVIWVSELKSGLPVAGADLEIRDDGNVVRWRGTTDEAGKAESPGWKVLGIEGRDEWAKPRQWVFARRGDDTAFTSSEWGTGVYPYRFGIDYDWNPAPETVRGYVFTERGIYRAGETVHVKGIVRRMSRGGWAVPPAGVVECLVRDPFQKTAHKSKADFDGFGSFSFDIETGAEAPLGIYEITATIPPEMPGEKAGQISESFRVEAFRPAEFEVHLRTPRDGYVFGDAYEGEVRAAYLSGGAMSGQGVDWHLRFNPADFVPPGHEGYAFGNEMDRDESRGAEESRLVASGDGTLDARGMLTVKAPLVAEKETETVLASLEATVRGPSRRTVSNRIQTIIHRGEYYIGLRPSSSFIEKGKGLTLDVIAADPKGAFLSGREILVRLLKREWRSVREAGVGGRFRWHTEKEDTEVTRGSVTSVKGPISLSYRPEKAGLYILAAESRDARGNPISTSAFFYVTGGDYVSWDRRDDDTIELVADAAAYKPGDTARILVKSPYEKARALVTVERETIIESRVLEIRGSSDRIEVPIRSEHIPNVFVSVLLLQGRTDQARSDERQDVGKPAFKMGYVKLSVSPDEKKLKVEIVRDRKDYGPKDRAFLNLKISDAKGAGVEAGIALAVVDIGVLNLIGYQTPDPFARFYGERPLSVQTAETRLHIVGQRDYGEKGEDAGGGGEKMLSSSPALSEVELRGDFKTTAYWNPSIATDASGEAVVAFDLPANLTSFRIMAVAQTKASSFGRGDDVFRVSKPLQLQPSLPRFARVGDKFEAGVVIRNLSEAPGTVRLSIDARGLTCLDASERTVRMDPGQSREVLFPFEALVPGRALLAFRAVMNDKSDGLEAAIPIQWPRSAETVALTGLTTGEAEEQIRIPDHAFSDNATLDLRASPTALGGLKDGLEYLKDYPYLCLEQRISAVLPYLLAPKLIKDFKLSPMDERSIGRFVTSALNGAYECQKEDGSFGLWPDSPWSSPYLTCYAVFALIKARASGFGVDDSRLDQSARYLKDWLRESPEEGPSPYEDSCRKTIRAFALYDLALMGKAEPAYADKLFTERGSLPLFGRSLLLKALHHGKGPARARQTLLGEIMNSAKVTAAEAHFEEAADPGLEWIYSSDLRTTCAVLQALVETEADHPLLPLAAAWITNPGRAGQPRSPQEAFYVFYALNDFRESREKERPDFEYRVALGETTLMTGAFHDAAAETETSQTKLGPDLAGRTLPLKAGITGRGTLYYAARMRYVPRRKLEPRDEGIAIVKSFASLDGSPLRSIKAGDLVVVTVEAALPARRLFVVVEDPLPAGFEAVNTEFLTESRENEIALAELEGEGSRGWEGFSHIETRDDRVLLFADSLAPGLHTHRYLVRALTPGSFAAPGPQASEMYAPEVFGRGAEQSIIIVK
jgi:alpha-2-macroglobulin